MEHRRAFITVADGTRLAAQLWLPERAPAPVAARGAPLPDGRPHRVVRRRSTSGCARRAASRSAGSTSAAPARPSGHRHRRVHGRRARRHLPGDRVARGAGVVERPRRHVRHLVVGLQLAPGRLPAPARARRDRSDLRLGRPLHRRRPLHGRRRSRRSTSIDWLLYMVAVQRAPARARGVRRRLARGVGAAGRRRRAVAAALVRGAGRRAVLAARLGAAGLRPDHLPDDDRRRLGRRLHEHRLPRLRGAHLPEARDPRPLGPRLDRDRAARARTSTSSRS